MSEKPLTFEEQYEDAFRALEAEDTELFMVVAANAAGDTRVVYGANTDADLEVGHTGLLAAAISTLADTTDQPVGGLLGEVLNRIIY